jgi:hypothetical protein
MTADQLKTIGYENKINQLESENAQLKQLLADFVKDANKQTNEIVRLRVIIERANSINGDIRVKEILNEADKSRS